jgi:hypothetical protein
VSNPDVTHNANIYLFTWKEEMVKGRFDHVRQHRDGRVAGELTFWPTGPGITGHIHHSKMTDLLGTNIKKTVVADLSKHIATMNWATMLETMCEYVLKDVRQGSPLKLLADVVPSEANEWRLHPILHEDMCTVMFGLGGSLKTFLATMCAVRVALGHDAEPGNVLILDWESSEDDWFKRVSMVVNGLGVAEPTNIFYRRCVAPLADDLEEIQAMGMENDINLYIIDSGLWACGGEAEKSEPTMEFFRAQRSLGGTTLVIAHQNSDDNTKKPYGNVMWVNSPRSTIQVIKAQDTPFGTPAEIGLYQRKVNFGIGFQPIGIKATFDVAKNQRWSSEDAVTFGKADVHESPDLAKGLPLNQKILHELNSGRKTVVELTDTIEGADGASIRRDLNRLKVKGLAVKMGDQWGRPDGTFTNGSEVDSEVTQGV